MTITFLKNDTTFNISAPYVYTSNYNETLDSLNCRIVHVQTKLDLLLLDKVLIDNQFYMVVSHYDIIEETLGEVEKTYTYELDLCSETKELEGVVLPALSITPLKENQRTIFDYLQEYLREYAPTYRKQNANSYDIVKKWEYSTRCETKFNVPAPEKQWGVSTFREVITDLMQVVDCIPVLKNGVIDFIDLTETKQPIAHYNYLRYSNDLSSHTSELQMNMQNVLQTQIDGVNNVVSTVEMIPFASDEYVLTSENLVLKTKYPILNVKKLEMVGYLAALKREGQETELTTVKRKDFCNIDGYSLVSETKEYQTKEVLYTTGGYDSSKTGEYYSKYQNYCVYFTRGSNEITGFNRLSKKWSVLSFEYQTYQWWQMITYGQAINTSLAENSKYYEAWFIIEYETQANQVFRTSKDERVNHHTTIDNQSNAWVEAYAQSNLEKQKANRLANEIVMLNQRWEVGDNFQPVKIGDYLVSGSDRLIAYQVQEQVYPDHKEINAFLTKNYILRDVFTGVNSKIRTWKNATDEAFQKEMLSQNYCEFSFNQRNETEIPDAKASYMITPLTDTENKPLKYALSYFSDSEFNNYPNDNDFYALDLISRQMGNSIVFATKMDDNTTIGKHINLGADDVESYNSSSYATLRYYRVRVKNDSLKGGGLKQQNYKYVDENFENTKASLYLFENVDLIGMPIENNTQLTLSEVQDLYVKEFAYPLIKENTVNLQDARVRKAFENWKDNKEIPSYSIQFEFLSDDKNIYATKYYVQNVKAISNIARQLPNVAIVDYQVGKEEQIRYVYNKLSYEVENINNNTVKITIHNNGIVLQSNMAYSIGRNYENWLVIKPFDFTAPECVFYLNILKDRDTHIYDTNGKVVGNI